MSLVKSVTVRVDHRRTTESAPHPCIAVFAIEHDDGALDRVSIALHGEDIIVHFQDPKAPQRCKVSLQDIVVALCNARRARKEDGA